MSSRTAFHKLIGIHPSVSANMIILGRRGPGYISGTRPTTKLISGLFSVVSDTIITVINMVEVTVLCQTFQDCDSYVRVEFIYVYRVRQTTV